MSTEFLMPRQLFLDMIFQQQLLKLLTETADSSFCFFTVGALLSWGNIGELFLLTKNFLLYKSYLHKNLNSGAHDG
jgi:hypothetical protein